MKQALIRLGFGLSFSLALLNCKGRPSDADCKKAIANIQALLGTDKSLSGYDLEGQVRRCRGGARVESVRCAIAAKTLDQLAACNLVDVSVARGSANPTPATGSAQVPTAGSANPTPATGSAQAPAAGSASPAPATSSAQAPAAGSANPTPATGSAAQTNK